MVPRAEPWGMPVAGQRTRACATLFEPATGQPQEESFYHSGWIGASKLHPSHRLVATASEDRSARLWFVGMRKPEPITLHVGQEVWEAQWNPAADRILTTATRDGG